MTADTVAAIEARSLELLEFPVIRERLAGHASFDGGAALCRAVTPSGDPAQVHRRRRETEEAILLEERAVTGPGGAFDVRAQIAHAARGGVLDIGTLERLDATIAVALEVREEVLGRDEMAPALAERLETGVAPPVLAGLAGVLERALDGRGGLLDTASPELADLRRRLTSARRDAADVLRRVAGRLGGHLQEQFTTERGGRPVLAVKASSRSAVPGIVHDTSATGHTLFIEPIEVVEANNRLREVEAMEAAEVERIVVELSRRTAAVAAALTSAIGALAAHDLALAGARLSYEWRGCMVQDAAAPRLDGARHPLLDPVRAVPIDLELDGISALVISGPNTGGKTVALKTLGILSACAQCGLRVPARAAHLPVFGEILVDIGDEQSIARNLSTFSAHVRRLAQIIDHAGPRTLVLLDEIAAGTDPDEGGPLAQAILERLMDAGARVVVTTHLGSLKEWAVGRPGAANAAVAIDPHTLQPRYAIVPGTYGASHALDIAESLGLPDAVIVAARAAMTPQRRQADALLRAAEKSQVQAEGELAAARAERQAAALAVREADALRRELEAEIMRTRARRDAERDAVRAEAQRDLEAASAELAALRNEIREARRAEARRQAADATGAPSRAARARDRSLGAAADAERRARARLAGPAPRPGSTVVALGDAVRDPVLGFRGVVVALEGDVAIVQGDAARVRVPAGRLEREGVRRPPTDAEAPRTERRPATRPAASQVDVRGRRAADACALVRDAVDAAAVAGLARVLVIHGHGTGALRAAVRSELARHPLVDQVIPAPPNEGGDGATYAVLEAR